MRLVLIARMSPVTELLKASARSNSATLSQRSGPSSNRPMSPPTCHNDGWNIQPIIQMTNTTYRGVQWDPKKKTWICRVRTERLTIRKRCGSEAEAGAHYNAMALALWPNYRDLKLNRAWDIRDNLGYDERTGSRIIEIDRETTVLVNRD
jgi:hypothetical protein